MKKTKVKPKKTEKTEPKIERKKRIYKFSKFRTIKKPENNLSERERFYMRRFDEGITDLGG